MTIGNYVKYSKKLSSHTEQLKIGIGGCYTHQLRCILGDLFNVIYTGDAHISTRQLAEELDYFASSSSTLSITTSRTLEGMSVD